MGFGTHRKHQKLRLTAKASMFGPTPAPTQISRIAKFPSRQRVILIRSCRNMPDPQPSANFGPPVRDKVGQRVLVVLVAGVPAGVWVFLPLPNAKAKAAGRPQTMAGAMFVGVGVGIVSDRSGGGSSGGGGDVAGVVGLSHVRPFSSITAA